ncbi:MAG: DUF721 domain-containing protein [Leptospira sp.]|nr:DUF721 domain-containing protein [Leptospira sp.]NCS93184.1 DUF721 domain-containing protein [Leptospira sp.]
MKDIQSDFSSLSNLSNQFDKNEIDKIIILKKLNRNWAELVGPVLANHSYAKDISSSSIVIETSHSAYSQEILFQSKKILDFIKSNSKFQFILKIKCTIGKLPAKLNKTSVSKKPTLDGKESLIQSLEKIKDEELKAKLLKIVEVMD